MNVGIRIHGLESTSLQYIKEVLVKEADTGVNLPLVRGMGDSLFEEPFPTDVNPWIWE